MLREGRGYKSHAAFAKAIGVAQSTVAGWESGRREPDFATVKTLADFFEVPIDFLLSDDCSPVVISKNGKNIWAQNPIAIISSQYHVPSEILSKITGASRETVEQWLNGSAQPNKDEYHSIAEFFQLDETNLKKGFIPFDTDKNVQLKVYGETNLRFAAYRGRESLSDENIAVIEKFLLDTAKSLTDIPGASKNDDV